MGFFDTILATIADTKRKVRYPLYKTADRTLAQILLGAWEPAPVLELLAAERDRDYGDDVLSAVQQRTAGAVLSRLVDLPTAPWLESLRAVSEPGELRIDEQQQADALDLLLAAAVLERDAPWAARVLRARYKHPPPSANCAWSMPVFAEAEALISGGKHAFPDLAAFASRAGYGAIYLALAIAQHGPRGAIDALRGASAALEADLVGSDGKIRARMAGDCRWHRRNQSVVELRGVVQGTGGPVIAVPWTLPLDMLAPWYELDLLCRGEVRFVNGDDGSPITALIENPEAEIRVTVSTRPASTRFAPDSQPASIGCAHCTPRFVRRSHSTSIERSLEIHRARSCTKNLRVITVC
jgi:hypothetical protein